MYMFVFLHLKHVHLKYHSIVAKECYKSATKRADDIRDTNTCTSLIQSVVAISPVVSLHVTNFVLGQ